jgi:hypothetical protein
MMSQTSTLASETYAYDQSGRLTEVQETPAGEGCTTRLYAYEETSNRTSLTTRKPGSEGKCTNEGGTVEAHSYDEAGRLTDSGITYDPVGNVTKLPASDAEGHALESSFYVDNAVATQTQNGVTNNYYLDPDGRIRETVTGSKKTITHYDGSGEAVAWTGEAQEKPKNGRVTSPVSTVLLLPSRKAKGKRAKRRCCSSTTSKVISLLQSRTKPAKRNSCPNTTAPSSAYRLVSR